MHNCIQRAPVRARSYQTEVHHLQDLRRQEEHCTRGNIHREGLGLLSHEAIWSSRQRWGTGSSVCHLRHGVWCWERREAVRHQSCDLMSAVECFSLILVPGCVGTRPFSSNGVLPARLSRWFCLLNPCAHWRGCKVLTVLQMILLYLSNRQQLTIPLDLKISIDADNVFDLEWGVVVEQVREIVSELGMGKWSALLKYRCSSTVHEEGLFLCNKVMN